MRKIVVLLCFLVIASSAFGLEKTAGFGAMFGQTFNKGNVDGLGDWKMPRTSFGVFGFFGVSKFLELNAGFLYKVVGKIEIDGEKVSASDHGIEPTGAIQLGAYGKYPFPLSDRIVIFPTVGADMEITVSSEEAWWHDLWIRAGAGVDYFLNEKMFLRGHFLYGVAIPMGGEADLGLKPGHGLLVKVGLGWMF